MTQAAPVRTLSVRELVRGEAVRTRAGRFSFQLLTEPEGTELCVCADGA